MNNITVLISILLVTVSLGIDIARADSTNCYTDKNTRNTICNTLTDNNQGNKSINCNTGKDGSVFCIGE